MIYIQKKKPGKKKMTPHTFNEIYGYSVRFKHVLDDHPMTYSHNDQICRIVSEQMIEQAIQGFLEFAFINGKSVPNAFICGEDTITENTRKHTKNALQRTIYERGRIYFEKEASMNAFLLIFHEHFEV